MCRAHLSGRRAATGRAGRRTRGCASVRVRFVSQATLSPVLRWLQPHAPLPAAQHLLLNNSACAWRQRGRLPATALRDSGIAAATMPGISPINRFGTTWADATTCLANDSGSYALNFWTPSTSCPVQNIYTGNSYVTIHFS